MVFCPAGDQPAVCSLAAPSELFAYVHQEYQSYGTFPSVFEHLAIVELFSEASDNSKHLSDLLVLDEEQ